MFKKKISRKVWSIMVNRTSLFVCLKPTFGFGWPGTSPFGKEELEDQSKYGGQRDRIDYI